jgi:DNA modification methylase
MNALTHLVLTGKEPWSIERMDCLEWLYKLPKESCDLIFADPPFNIDYQYDHYKDKVPKHQYESWTRQWLGLSIPRLKPGGSLVVAINDENAAEVKVFLDKWLTMRNWIIWHYSFGTHQKKKFGRDKTHLLYFVKDPKAFTFNADDIRVPSKRLTKYKDKRANPLGRVPGDVWKMSRLCGTFKERTGHPCQMNELVLERIIKALTNPDDVVCDPFGGSFTTAAVAHRLGRRAISCDTSKDYCNAGKKRLEAI